MLKEHVCKNTDKTKICPFNDAVNVADRPIYSHSLVDIADRFCLCLFNLVEATGSIIFAPFGNGSLNL